MSQTIRFFGIRHHGPGCARSLVRALNDLQPDCLLMEGPPEGEELLPFMLHEAMRPPVALLAYAQDEPSRAAFYPFAVFSPEWQALRYALERGIVLHFMDLPIAQQFALDKEYETMAQEKAEAACGECPVEATDVAPPESARAEEGQTSPAPQEDTKDAAESIADPADPLDWFGRAAGYGDGEAWWNRMVEERSDDFFDIFEAVREAMTVLREEAPPRGENVARREALREAHMRQSLRRARKNGFERIAVVCGAWHVPALENLPPAKDDAALLKGLPKMKVSVAWTPWTYAHLTRAGYKAGVASPAWYEHLWQSAPERRAVGWLTRAAHLFRAEGMDCSSAHIIECVRFAESLAALRERSRPGLNELYESLRAVVCLGDDVPLRLIRRRLMVGEQLGTVPPDVPAVPLQRDLELRCKQLRLKREASRKLLDLDLRCPGDLERSRLLHRLGLLEVAWGTLTRGEGRSKGTFHEVWEMEWTPGLTLNVIMANRWGNTIVEAASHRVGERSVTAELAELAQLVDGVLLADLPDAMAIVVRALEERAATASDVVQLLEAIPPLASIARYGNVRQTDAGQVTRVLHGLAPRAAIGLPGACVSLDGERAAALRKILLAVHPAIQLLDEELREAWRMAMFRIVQREDAHALLRGLAVRLLLDGQTMPIEDAARRMNLALSAGGKPEEAAAWIEGFLNEDAMVLLHDNAVWTLLDDWLATLSEEHFMHILPLLRRTFATFHEPERRRLGERARMGTIARDAGEDAYDLERAVLPLPLLRRVLGLSA